MKALIEEFRIPNRPTSFLGLKASVVSRMHEITIFAGPNGGGKSRLLNLIKEHVGQIEGFRGIDEQINNLLAQKTDLMQKDELDPVKLVAATRVIDQQVALQKERLSNFISFNLAKGLDRSPTVLYFAPNIAGFVDPNSLTSGQSIQLVKNAGSIKNIAQSFSQSLLTIQSLVGNYLISRTAESQFSNSDADDLKHKFDNLRELINSLLGMSISWTAGPAISIGDTPLDKIDSNFSKGQKWLLHFAASAYSDIALNDPLVLCLDEPELHLHPAAVNQIIDILSRTLTGGQLLIATHSIPLIAHVGYENTWFVSDGSVTYAGQKPEIIINGLVGGGDGVQKLSSLLREPEAAALSQNYLAFESLLAPEVAAARTADPQSKQILNGLRAKCNEMGRTVKVLDYGAGKGRIIDIAFDDLGPELGSLLDYNAFDPSNENAENCKAAIARAYGSSDNRYFNIKSNIPETLAGNKFDVVVLCNVMHEISPTEWLNEFLFIQNLLHDHGEVLIVEDLLLPHGESAHSDGFVIASKEALRLLFGVNAVEAAQIREIRNARADTPDRLMCIGMPSKFIERISNKTVKEALSYINDHARRRIDEIRASNDTSYKTGLQHALYLHQFANSTFALKRLA